MTANRQDKTPLDRDERQARIFAWAKAAFSAEEATSLPQRGIRLLEEAIEAFQASGGDPLQAKQLIDFVFKRPVGELGQEIGGVSVCLLALAAAAGLSAEAEERREVERVLAKPIEEFTRRNAAKNSAGFLASTVVTTDELRALQSPATIVQPRSVPNDGPQIEERRVAGEIPVDYRRRVLYFAAPLRPTLAEMGEMSKCGVFDVPTEPGSRAAADLESAIRKCAERANLNRAKEGLSALRRAFPETTFIAPWIASVLSGEDDSDPAQREAGLRDACSVVERCDGIVLLGSRLSDGMRREMEHGVRSRDLFEVYNLVGVQWQMVMADTRGMEFVDWYSGVLGSQHPGSF